MTKYIDADALIDAMTKFSNATGEDMTHGIFYAHIAPTIDAVPVIRCKDCKHRIMFSSENVYKCLYSDFIAPEHYCGYAERKETS